MKNKIAAAMIAFFFGGFGIHKFYLGESKKGLLYFLFAWTGIPAILAFIDFIILLTMDDKIFNQKYNK